MKNSLIALSALMVSVCAFAAPQPGDTNEAAKTPAVSIETLDETSVGSSDAAPSVQLAGTKSPEIEVKNVDPTQFIQQKSQPIDLFVGQAKVLGVHDLTRVVIGQGRVLRVQVLESGELLVIGESKGASTLQLWHRDGSQSKYNIHVAEKDPQVRVNTQDMIRIQVKMVEFRKSALSKVGIDWAKDVSGPTFGVAGDLITNSLFRPAGSAVGSALPLAVKPFSTYFGLTSVITSRINFMASSGDALTIAEPVLSCVNGGKAKFLAGGEVPYPVVGKNGETTVEFKEYGIKLDINPRADANGNISTSILTEVSQLDPAVSIGGAPGLITRRTETMFNVKSGRTIVLAGLVNAETSKDIDKVPGLGSIPYLGALFRSENFRNSVSELVIFVTPYMIPYESQKLNNRDQRFYDEATSRQKKLVGELGFKILD